MNYEPLTLQSPLYQMVVSTPEGCSDIVVIRNMRRAYLGFDGFTSMGDRLEPLRDELIDKGITKIVIDASKFPKNFKGHWVAFLERLLEPYGLDTRYVGVTLEEITFDKDFKEMIEPKISLSLEDAVKSLGIG
jgi:hypothetical protein